MSGRTVCAELVTGVGGGHRKTGPFPVSVPLYTLSHCSNLKPWLRRHSKAPFKMNPQVSVLVSEEKGIDKNLIMRNTQYFQMM